MKRREFVAGLAGLPFVIGLSPRTEDAGHARGPVTRERDPGSAADLLVRARAEMRRWDLPGLVFVVPRDPTARRWLGVDILRLLEGGPFAPVEAGGTIDWPEARRTRRRARALVSSCVLLCLEEDDARELLDLRDPVAAMRPDGRVVGTLPERPALFHRAFIDEMITLVHGSELTRLRRRVAAHRDYLTVPVRDERERFIRGLATRATRGSDRLSARAHWIEIAGYGHLPPPDEVPATDDFTSASDRVGALTNESPIFLSWLVLEFLTIAADFGDLSTETELESILIHRCLRPSNVPRGTFVPRFVYDSTQDPGALVDGTPLPGRNLRYVEFLADARPSR
ncbi:MAG: hypothetical protein R3F20_06310 [Planctomycetota bacterium]